MVSIVECWDVLELSLTEAAYATFRKDDRVFVAEAFDDGGRSRIQFMPDEPGEWSYQAGELVGTFVCTPSSAGNHGPVLAEGGRFRYADGTAYVPWGTTALWWHEQDAAHAETVRTLASSPFTKVRMSVTSPGGDGWPGPKELARVEGAVRDLRGLGIEAELVLFHAGGSPGWQGYVRQVVARLAAYRNVWWCVAADVDRADPPAEGWDEVLALVEECDYGHHLRTLHGGPDVDFGRRSLTHASVRHDETRVVSRLAERFAKPVVIDGCGCEGDAPVREGSLLAEQVVTRIWDAVCRGGYASHGEWFADEAGPWWSHGGRLRGESAARIAFARQILAGAPAEVRYRRIEHDASTLEVPGQYYLQYYGPHRFRRRDFSLPEGEYRVEVVDTWAMTVTERSGTLAGEFELELPGELYQAVRIRRCYPPHEIAPEV